MCRLAGADETAIVGEVEAARSVDAATPRPAPDDLYAAALVCRRCHAARATAISASAAAVGQALPQAVCEAAEACRHAGGLPRSPADVVELWVFEPQRCLFLRSPDAAPAADSVVYDVDAALDAAPVAAEQPAAAH